MYASRYIDLSNGLILICLILLQMKVRGSSEPYGSLQRCQLNIPGQQIAYTVCWPVLDMLNDIAQPFSRLHIVHTACADQRVQHRCMFSTAVGTREEALLPACDHTP